MPHLVPRRVLVLGCLLVMTSGWWPGPEAEPLLGVPPMAGRPNRDSVTLTLHGGTRPVRVFLEVARIASDRHPVFRPLVFATPEVRTDPDGRQVIARIPEAGTAGSGVLLSSREYLEIVASGLEEGVEYHWRLRVEEHDPGGRRGAAVLREQHEGRLVTRRPRGESFRFAIISDMHFFIGGLEAPLPRETELHEGYLHYALQGIQWLRETKARIEAEFGLVAQNIVADRPDFVIGLGDHFDLNQLGFNAPLLSQEMAETAHRETREHLVRGLNAAGPMFQLLGNWEGESGDHAPEHRAFARHSRKRYQINPRVDTPGYLGAPDEDYYAWRWGDVLFVALNVRGYTPTSHLLDSHGHNAGAADDFTLGPEQRRFLENVLKSSDLPYKVILTHHTVGGEAGDQDNSAYGRGGGQAAHVGEQAWVHDLMKEHGVQVLFYGHDHVFTDMVVDGIHYTLAGTTGAPWRFTTAETGYQEYWPDSGHARVDVNPDRMRVELVDFRGDVLYSYEVEPRR